MMHKLKITPATSSSPTPYQNTH